MDGTIINKHQLCNGVIDCGDLSDECLCDKREWAESHPQRYRQITDICDAQMVEPRLCKIGEFSCTKSKHSKCVKSHQLCDGVNDCGNSEDEQSCTALQESNSQLRSTRILVNTPTCKYSSRPAVYCDGRPECFPRFEDECECEGELPAFCMNGSSSSLFIVKDCYIAPHQVCDGVYDCPNGEDEDMCPMREACDPSGSSKKSFDTERER